MLARAKVRQALAYLSVDPARSLAIAEELHAGLPALEQAAGPGHARGTLLNYARISIEANRYLGRYPKGIALIEEHVTEGSVGENADLGFQSAELYLAARKREEAARMIELVERAQVASEELLRPLREKLAQLEER